MERDTTFDELYNPIDMPDVLSHEGNNFDEFLFNYEAPENVDMPESQHHNNAEITTHIVDLSSAFASADLSGDGTYSHDALSNSEESVTTGVLHDSTSSLCEIQTIYCNTNTLTYQTLNTMVRISNFQLC